VTGAMEGCEVRGDAVGFRVGDALGRREGDLEGVRIGDLDGAERVGALEGVAEGVSVVGGVGDSEGA
jgi:hypothetical protein